MTFGIDDPDHLDTIGLLVVKEERERWLERTSWQIAMAIPADASPELLTLRSLLLDVKLGHDFIHWADGLWDQGDYDPRDER